MTSRIKFWPESSQKPLLQAAFLQGEASIQAWQVWKLQINMDDYPDLGSSRLLPVMYRNLKEQGIDDPLMMKFKGVGRKAWYRNQRFFESIAQPLQALHQEQIKAMLLYEPPLALRYNSDYQMGSVAALAVLVPTHQAVAAVECLQRRGWQSDAKIQPAAINSTLSAAYMHTLNDALQRKIQLHWHLLPEDCRPDADADFWAAATPDEVRGQPAYLLNPADHLLHICVQDTTPPVIPLFSRVVDAMFVISATQPHLAWERLVAQATQRQLVLPVLNVLTYLHNALGEVVPLPVLQQLQACPVSSRDEVEARLKNHRRLAVRQTSRLWFNHARNAGHANALKKLAGFPAYLQRFWQLEHVGQVPQTVIAGVKAWYRLRQPG